MSRVPLSILIFRVQSSSLSCHSRLGLVPAFQESFSPRTQRCAKPDQLPATNGSCSPALQDVSSECPQLEPDPPQVGRINLLESGLSGLEPLPWKIPSNGNCSKPAAFTTDSKSRTQASNEKSGTFQSDRPHPLSSYLISVLSVDIVSSQWRHTGLCQSNSKWLR